LWQSALFEKLPDGFSPTRALLILESIPVILALVAFLDLMLAHIFEEATMPHVAQWNSTAFAPIGAGAGPDGALLLLLLSFLSTSLILHIRQPLTEVTSAAFALRQGAMMVLIVGLAIDDKMFTVSEAVPIADYSWPMIFIPLSAITGVWLSFSLRRSAIASEKPPTDPGSYIEPAVAIIPRVGVSMVLIGIFSLQLSPEAWSAKSLEEIWRIIRMTPAAGRLVATLGLMHLVVAAPVARWAADREAAKGGASGGRWRGLAAVFALHALAPIAIIIPNAWILHTDISADIWNAFRWSPWILLGAVAGANLPSLGIDRHIRPEMRGAGIGVAFAAITLALAQPESLFFARVSIFTVALAPLFAGAVERIGQK
jgi:hypothetical protein